jgi:hypothetical protein
VDGRFLQAFTDPARVSFLGRLVYPFCLKYRVRLLAVDSPFVTEGRNVTPLDLLTAVKICAEEPIGPLGWKDKLIVLRMERRPSLFIMDVERFVAYVQATSWPKFWSKNTATKGEAEDAGIPWPLGIVTALVKAGWEEKRAWEMPECQAVWYSSAIAAAAGSESKLLTTDEEAFMDDLEKQEKVAKAAEVKTPEPNGPET